MLNTMFSIVKYLEDTLSIDPFRFDGEVKVDHANYIDINDNLPKILVSDSFWDWRDEQFGSFAAKTLSPLEVEVFAGSKIQALRIVTWIVGKELRGNQSNDGVLLYTEIPLIRFDADGNPGDVIGVVKFGNETLPTVQFVTPVNVGEVAYNYVIRFMDVVSILNKEES